RAEAELDRQRAERALRTSEQRLEMAVSGAQLGLWDLNIQTGGLVVNDEFCRVLEYEPGQLHPHLDHWDQYVHPDDLARSKAAWNRYLSSGASTYEDEYRIKTRT